MRSYFALKKLKKRESFFSWLFGIATRVAKEQQRAVWRQRDMVKSLPERSVDRSRSHDYDLERAVSELGEPYRQVILLRYYGGMSCGEVAEQLAVPLGTVTKRLSRAYAMLRDSLGRADGLRERSEVQP